jgi:hypothetical protein
MNANERKMKKANAILKVARRTAEIDCAAIGNQPVFFIRVYLRSFAAIMSFLNLARI